MEIKGKVHEVGETAQVTDSLKKRELVVEYAENPQYPEYIKFEAIQDRTSLMDGVAVGDEVEVAFNLKGRPWTNREGKTVYFTTLQLWKLTKLTGGAQAPAANARLRRRCRASGRSGACRHRGSARGQDEIR